MLITPSTLDHLELIAFCALAAAALVACVVAVVGMIAAVVFREPGHDAAIPTYVAEGAPMDVKRQAA